jgi:putative ABC transport system permease protein
MGALDHGTENKPMELLFKDLRHAVRDLLKRPGFTIIIVLTLALGIGANSAIFSVVNTVLLQPLPFPEPERLVRMGEGSSLTHPERGAFSFPDFRDVRAQTQSLEYVAAYLNSGGMLASEGADAERVLGADVSSDYFNVLGVKPQLGRTFTAEEDHPAATVVVISHGLWQRRFAGSPEIIGKQIKLGASSLTVIGVMPSGFEFPFRPGQDFWEPLNDRPTPDREVRDARMFDVIGRTKPGVSVAQANAELRTIGKRLEQQYPEANTNVVIAGSSLHDDLTRDVRPALLVLLGTVGFVLLIACANVANLLLARAASRQKEIAIRSALGASRLRIIRQLLVESVLLALAGGAFGLLLATWGVDLIVATGPTNIPRLQQTALDARVLAFTLFLSSLAGILFGLVPALQASKPHLNDSLKDAARGTTESLHRNRARSAMVISEVALSLVLLIGAGLLLRSFVRLLHTNPGFDAAHVIALDIPLSRQRYDTPEKQSYFFQRLIERTKTLPGIQSAGVVNLLPLGNSDNEASFNIAGRAPFPAGSEAVANYTVVSPGYFDALKIPLRSGRMIGPEDKDKSPLIILISEELARRYFPGENPLGHRLIIDDNGPREIVGVMGDVRRESLEVAATPEFYLPHEQEPTRRLNLVVRTETDPASATASLRGVIKELDPDQMVWQTRTLDQLVASSVAGRRFNLLLLGIFASVALVLAALGIYGVMAYSVTRRTHEFGVRLALGAQVSDVLRLVLKKGMALALAGITIGLVISLPLTRLMASLLFGVTPTDLPTYFAISAGLLVVALIACYVPARRATKVDPLTALRYE